MTTTASLGLKKPAPTDFVDPTPFNENADILEAAILARYGPSNKPVVSGGFTITEAGGDINLGGSPSILLLWKGSGNSVDRIGIVVRDSDFSDSTGCTTNTAEVDYGSTHMAGAIIRGNTLHIAPYHHSGTSDIGLPAGTYKYWGVLL